MQRTRGSGFSDLLDQISQTYVMVGPCCCKLHMRIWVPWGGGGCVGVGGGFCLKKLVTRLLGVVLKIGAGMLAHFRGKVKSGQLSHI